MAEVRTEEDIAEIVQIVPERVQTLFYSSRLARPLLASEIRSSDLNGTTGLFQSCEQIEAKALWRGKAMMGEKGVMVFHR